MIKSLALVVATALAAALAANAVLAQSGPAPSAPAPPPMSHGRMHGGSADAPGAVQASAGAPTQPGQDAFGAIAEVVRILDADPRTDWSRVDLERLRQHLIDMNEVVLRAEVKQTPVPGGLAMDITGTGRTAVAIRAMVVSHAAELAAMPNLLATTEEIAGGVRLTVTAKAPDDLAVARLRALGFAGLLTLGAHHGPHHLAMARGDSAGGDVAGGGHKHH